MLSWRRKPTFDPEILSSVWVMACRDESPVLTAYSTAYRLGHITPAEVMELVNGRRELFRLGLTSGQSRGWKDRYRKPAGNADQPPEPPAPEGSEPAPPKRTALPDWLNVFDDGGSEESKRQVKEWLADDGISTSQQALERFLDGGFVIDDKAFRSQFRLDPDLRAEPSDLATVNWGLEHIERLRRGHAENRQGRIALTTGIGGVAIGALVALTAPLITTLYQGRPLDTARLTFEHQTLLSGYAALGAAVADAQGAARARNGEALAAELRRVGNTTSALQLLLDPDTRRSLKERQAGVARACETSGPLTPTCAQAIQDLQQLVDGPLAEALLRERP
jgi:hypothetical protein